jgi:hypothetical protein
VGRYQDAGQEWAHQQHDDVQFGSARPPRRSPRWLPRAVSLPWTVWVPVAAVAGIALTIALAVPHSRESSRAARQVTFTSVGHRLLGVRTGWQLFARGPGVVVRIQFARGRITRTRLPPLQSTGAVSFVAIPGAVIVRPWDSVPGYFVSGGRRAHGLPRSLSHGGPVFPGPRPGLGWVQTNSGTHTAMRLSWLAGGWLGRSVRMPAGDPWPLGVDGQGNLLLQRAGGVYDALASGPRLVTTGNVLATGPPGVLVTQCPRWRHCPDLLINPVRGIREALPGLRGVAGRAPFSAIPPDGAIAPDGSAAAVVVVGRAQRPSLDLLDLRSGASHRLNVTLDPAGLTPESLAWSPDSRWLFVIGSRGRLAAVNAATYRAASLGVALPWLSQVITTSAGF